MSAGRRVDDEDRRRPCAGKIGESGSAREPDLAPAPPMRLAETLPAHTDAFIIVVANFCAASQRDEWAERLLRLADEIVSPAERKKQRLARRDDLIRELAGEYYSTVAGFRPKARLIKADLAAVRADTLNPGSIKKNFLLREILDLNQDEDLSVESLRKILGRLG